MSKQLEPATGRQLHTIAILCLILDIDDRLEDNPMSKGEAGILIRRLLNEKKAKNTKAITRQNT